MILTWIDGYFIMFGSVAVIWSLLKVCEIITNYRYNKLEKMKRITDYCEPYDDEGEN